MCVVAMPVRAEKPNLQTQLNAQLLRAAKHDTSLSDREKLFSRRCETIEKHVGFSDTPLGQSIEYSCKGMVIGVTLYAGADLGKHSPEKVAALFKEKLSNDFMTAEVFVKHDHEYGSAMAFLINGGSYTEDWADPLEALEFLDGMTAEARLIYFNNKQITSQQLVDWVKGSPPDNMKY